MQHKLCCNVTYPLSKDYIIGTDITKYYSVKYSDIKTSINYDTFFILKPNFVINIRLDGNLIVTSQLYVRSYSNLDCQYSILYGTILSTNIKLNSFNNIYPINWHYITITSEIISSGLLPLQLKIKPSSDLDLIRSVETSIYI